MSGPERKNNGPESTFISTPDVSGSAHIVSQGNVAEQLGVVFQSQIRSQTSVNIWEQDLAEMTPEVMFSRLRDVLVDTLGLNDEEVIMSARLTADLGAESIDFLDIVFRIEKAFGVKIARGTLFSAGEILRYDDMYCKDGRATEAGISEIEKKLPHLDLSEFRKNPVVENTSDLQTVGAIMRFLEIRQRDIRKRMGAE
jgi:acyl carrier protein